MVCVCSVAQLYPTLCSPVVCSLPGSSVHGIFSDKNTGVGCQFLLQRIFLTQGSNSCVLHWQVDSLPLHHLGSPKSWVSLGQISGDLLLFYVLGTETMTEVSLIFGNSGLLFHHLQHRCSHSSSSYSFEMYLILVQIVTSLIPSLETTTNSQVLGH